ncbi:MAG: hypothetical protein LPJ89_08820, partial [Hymenobacteraceae bacterium]|nr:hypothetical protein [Hymenobacteraceae bacterium]
MKKAYLFLLAAFATLYTQAQTSNYWQQEVNYKINVALNDQAHTLSGFEEVEYVNNSPDTISFIYFHLWPNAYKNTKTAFAKQQLVNNSRKFQFADKESRGYIDSLNFVANGSALRTEADPENPDIIKVYLGKPLQSKERIRISTPFFVKLPDSFSRLGHVGQSY